MVAVMAARMVARSAGPLPVRAGDQAVPADDQPVRAGDQAVPADDQPVRAGDQAVPADNQPVPADNQPVPADDLVVIVAEDDQDAPDDHDATAAEDDEGDTADGKAEPDLAAFVPDRAAAAGESPSAFAGDDADDAAAGETGIGGRPAADADQPLIDAGPPDVPAAVSPEPGPAHGAGAGSAGEAGRWPEIQAMFVDDPRASVELAADLVDDSLEAFIASVKQRHGSLRSTWSGNDADTEQLRTALQRYRAFWRHLHSMSIEP